MDARDASIENVLTQAFFLDLMKDMADENKVEKMVICLKVPETIFISLKRDFHRDTSLLATKALMAWRDNLTCETVEEAGRELIDVFKRIDLARKSTLIQAHINEHTNGSIATNGVVHTTALAYFATETDGRTVEHAPPSSPCNTIPPDHKMTPFSQRMKRKCTLATCGWTVCYLTLGMLVVVAVVAIPSVKFSPKTKNRVSPRSVRENDTVELSFSLPTSWLETLSLSIDQGCTAVAYTHRGQCRELYSTSTVCYHQAEFAEGSKRINYLLPGSYLNFSVGANYQCKTDIWFTWNPELLHERNFSRFSCDDPPPQTECQRPLVERTGPTNLMFNVTEAAYYATWISPLPDDPCDLSLERYICSYNVTQLEETASAVSQEPIQSDPVTVDLLYRPYSFDQVCTILHVHNDDYHCTGFDGGKLSVEMGRRQDVLLFPCLLVALSVVILLTVAVTHTVCVVRRRRRFEARYERVPSTHV